MLMQGSLLSCSQQTSPTFPPSLPSGSLSHGHCCQSPEPRPRADLPPNTRSHSWAERELVSLGGNGLGLRHRWAL